MRGRISACLVALMTLAAAGSAVAQERFGGLTGRATDQQGLALPGLTVTVTNLQSGEVRSLVTDADGRYNAPDLIPGRYRVRFELAGFSVVERTDILVLLGRTFTLDAQLSVGALTETVQVVGETPLIDQRNTLVAHNVSAEEFDRMPKGRSFQSLALTAPSVNAGEIEGGFQVNGASGAENSFTVDGIVTNSLVSGQSRQNTVFEYLQEVQVKTSGIQAEYGGALGGVLSAVTKSGGNTFRGEGHYYFEGNVLTAGPVKRLVLSPTDNQTVSFVQDVEQHNAQNEFGGSLGGPIVRDRLFFFGSYSPRSENRDNNYGFTDQGGNIERQIWRQQLFGKATFASRRLNANASALWTPTYATGTLAAYNGAAPNAFVGTSASLAPNIDRGYEINQVNASGSVDVTLTNASFVTVRGGTFHDRYSDTGISNVTSYTYGQPTTPLNAIIPPELQGGTGTTNTPRARITDFDLTNRDSFNIDYNHVFNAGGLHTLKTGYGFQRTTNDINSFFPGGYVIINWDQAFTFGGSTPQRGIYGYYEVNDQRTSNIAGNSIHSLFIQDQWTIGNRLTLNLGLRTENEKVPTFRPEVLKYAFEFGFADKMAPRLGAAYDLRGDGRQKVFGSWGLYYDWTKYELVRGSFGAESWCQYYRALNTLDIGSLNLNNMPGQDIWVTPGSCRDRRVPSFQGSIDPEIEPMRQASTSLGYELQVNRNSVFTVHYIHNELLETIEDVGFLTSTGDEGYLISNPGKRQAAVQFAYGATPGPQPVPRPKRQYDAMELGFTRRFANSYFFSANYTLSRLYGNYAGLASSDEIRTPTTGQSSAAAQQQAGTIARGGGNVNRAWDIDEILWDSNGNLDPRGRLATDRPHVAKLYGSYDFTSGTQIGAFFYAGSGTPMTTYVTSNHGADIFVNGRGDMGRTPALTRTDVLVTQQVRLGAKALRFELNVLNVFNQKTTRHIYNYLNRGTGPLSLSNLIDTSAQDLSQGYDPDALIRATPNGTTAYDPRYGMADLFEDGTRGFVTVKFLF